MGEENVTPPSEDLLKNTEKFPGLSSNQTMLMFPLSSTAICGSCELPALFDAFTGREKTTWPSAAIAATTRNAPTVPTRQDRKSTRLNSSHSQISYAVFCLKQKNMQLVLD